MAAITICSDFGAPKNKVWHCFHCFPIYFPWSDGTITLVHPKANQSWTFIGKTDAEAEIPILWPADVKYWLIGDDPDAGKDWRREEKGTTEDETVGWYHWLDGHEFEQAPGVGDGQGNLVCCSLCCCRVGHDWVTELNWGSVPDLKTCINVVISKSYTNTREMRVWK